MSPLFAVILLAGASFKTPLPVPNLVAGSPDAVFAALGEPGRIIEGADAKKICQGACDEIRVYGPESAPPEVTTASAFVYFEKNRVTSVKWIFAGKLAKPDSYPAFKKVFEDGLPIDLEEIESHDPITVDGITDATRRKLTWVHAGYSWTALVLCPLVREIEGAERIGMRKALAEEWRVVLVEAGPLKVERRKIACDPSGKTPFPFYPGDRLPSTAREREIWAPSDISRGETELGVVMRLSVGADGKVTEVTVVRGHPRIGENAAATLRKWRFESFLCEGTPIPWTGVMGITPP